jgi:hypothetical protein
MNENKIAFIICYNDELCMSECVRYINRLNVPIGIETDIMGIQGAESMCAGYNAAMKDSDAKYKVYMHQDVFILNANFIADVINAFKENPQYGLIGVYGADRAVRDANYWNVWSVGVTRWGSNLIEDSDSVADAKNPPTLKECVAVDGMMMITQVDLMWREDVFDGFDMYDISQSVEFAKAGYKVGVVHQSTVWCLHDCGRSRMDKYDAIRKKFCEEYRQYGYEYVDSSDNSGRAAIDKRLADSTGTVERLMEAGDAEGAYALMAELSKNSSLNNRLAMYAVICEIMHKEKLAGAHEFFNETTNRIPALVAKFIRYKYFLRRVELGFPLEDDEVYKEIAARADKRFIDLCTLAPHVTLEPQATIRRLALELGL